MHGKNKMTEEQKKKCIELYSTGKYKMKNLAIRYGVSQPTISRLIKEWKNESKRNV